MNQIFTSFSQFILSHILASRMGRLCTSFAMYERQDQVVMTIPQIHGKDRDML